jgi:hypothetical protein
MADAKPVETTDAPTPPARNGLWARQTWRRKLMLAVVGPAILAVGGWHGLQYFKADPGKAVAQSDPPAAKADPLPEVKPAEPTKKPAPASDLPDIPAVATEPPTTKPADRGFAADSPVTRPGPNRKTGDDPSDIVAPPIPSSPNDKSDDSSALDIAPPAPIPDGPPKPRTSDDNRIRKPAEDTTFRAADLTKPGPAPRPIDDRPDTKGPIIRVGGISTDDNKGPKKDDPPLPNIDDIKPPSGPAPMTGAKDDPPIVLPPIDTKGPKKDDPPTIVMPKTKKDEPPLPMIDLGPSAVPTPPSAPRIEVPAAPPVGPAAAPVKRDSFDEDWHTPRPGEGLDYVAISREYYKTADYARALESYNRGRRDGIIRVPPTWVLEERFGGLIQKGDPPPAADARPTGNATLGAGTPTPAIATSGRRPAPPSVGGASTPPIATSQDEYKVTAPAGETIREIAQKVLGNANAWRRVWDLNQDVDPTQPIPAGTTLRLPR